MRGSKEQLRFVETVLAVSHCRRSEKFRKFRARVRSPEFSFRTRTYERQTGGRGREIDFQSFPRRATHRLARNGLNVPVFRCPNLNSCRSLANAEVPPREGRLGERTISTVTTKCSGPCVEGFGSTQESRRGRSGGQSRGLSTTRTRNSHSRPGSFCPLLCHDSRSHGVTRAGDRRHVQHREEPPLAVWTLIGPRIGALAHYNFVRLHKSLRVTPAMAAGVSDRLWTFEELVEQTSR